MSKVWVIFISKVFKDHNSGANCLSIPVNTHKVYILWVPFPQAPLMSIPLSIRPISIAIMDKGLIEREPSYHTVFPVGNDEVRREQLGDGELEITTPVLKKRAIIQSVDEAVTKYGSEPAHTFGMSDDDPENVSLIVRAMCVSGPGPRKRRGAVVLRRTELTQRVDLDPCNERVQVRLPEATRDQRCGPFQLVGSYGASAPGRRQ